MGEESGKMTIEKKVYIFAFIVFIIIVNFGILTGFRLFTSLDIFERFRVFSLLGTVLFGILATGLELKKLGDSQLVYDFMFLILFILLIIIVGPLITYCYFVGPTPSWEIDMHLLIVLALSFILTLYHFWKWTKSDLGVEEKKEAKQLLISIDIPAFITFLILYFYWNLLIKGPENIPFVAGAFAFELIAFNCAFALIKSRIILSAPVSRLVS